MGYRHMEIQNLRSIIRRYVDDQSVQEISLQEGFDRKTVRRYLTAVEEHSIKRGTELPDDSIIRNPFPLLFVNEGALVLLNV